MNTETAVKTLMTAPFTAPGLRTPADAASAVHAPTPVIVAGMVSGSDGGAGNG